MSSLIHKQKVSLRQSGASMLFFDRMQKRVVLLLRDNKDSIMCPNMLGIPGGAFENGETPTETVVREIAEELSDTRTGDPYQIKNFELFKSYIDEWGAQQNIFCMPADFDLHEIILREGQKLVWFTEPELQTTTLAFGFNTVIREFFASRYMTI